MYEGLWTAVFRSNVGGAGTGVAVFRGGKVLGGDSQFTYVGRYKATQGLNQADQIEAQLEITEYHKAAGATSVFGPLTKFRLELKGHSGQGKLSLNGHVVEHPQSTISMELTKRADL